jgi:predicted amidohydrolase
LDFYTAGNHFVVFEVNQIKCGLLICYDVRFPELYRAYKQMDVKVLFQSFYNARQKPGGIHPKIMPLTAQARAATNAFYMSLTNSSAAESWPCHFITPDGLIAGKSETNQATLLISQINLQERFYDASSPFRENAMKGILSSGPEVADSRSTDRTSY